MKTNRFSITLLAALAMIMGLTSVQSVGADVSAQEESTAPPILSNIQAIELGGGHTCALTDAGGVKCWGGNFWGQIGDGTTYTRYTPMDVVGLSSGIKAISAGRTFTCALTMEGGVKCWGSNGYGQLGNGIDVERHVPVDVLGLSGEVIAISAGDQHICALMLDHSLECWGKNAYGQLGDGTTTQRNQPTKVVGIADDVIAISAGENHTCALTSSGGAKCWGYNRFGQLGDTTTAQRLVPTDVFGFSSGVSAISAGMDHSCALTTTGGVMCWGRNNYGQLGNAQNTNSLAPVNVSGMTSGMVSVHTGEWHTCGMTLGGGIKCWGLNRNGQLGDGTLVNSNVPLAVLALSSGILELSAGDIYNCALTSSGTVKCWGNNMVGQLGNGTNRSQRIPANVLDLKTAHFRSNPGRDGFILETEENSNIGGRVNSTDGFLRIGDDDQNRQYLTILSFNTAALPDTAVIHFVQLTLFLAGGHGDPYWSYKVVDIRKPFFGASDRLAAEDFQANASRSAVGNFAQNSDIVALRKAAFPYINLAGFTQFRARIVEDDDNDLFADYVIFHGGEAETQLRPLLLVVYYVP